MLIEFKVQNPSFIVVVLRFEFPLPVISDFSLGGEPAGPLPPSSISDQGRASSTSGILCEFLTDFLFPGLFWESQVLPLCWGSFTNCSLAAEPFQP